MVYTENEHAINSTPDDYFDVNNQRMTSLLNNYHMAYLYEKLNITKTNSKIDGYLKEIINQTKKKLLIVCCKDTL